MPRENGSGRIGLRPNNIMTTSCSKYNTNDSTSMSPGGKSASRGTLPPRTIDEAEED